jgi:hypothetical protein
VTGLTGAKVPEKIGWDTAVRAACLRLKALLDC